MLRSELGRLLVGIGALLVVLGVLLWSGAFKWFGRLPGDIRIEGETVRIYVPLVSMLLISVLLTLLFNLLRRFL